MKRPFLVEEVMLDGVSGEVRGTILWDQESGTIEEIDFADFCFRRDDIDSPAMLDEAQQAAAKSIVEHVLRAQRDLRLAPKRITASAERFSPPATAAASTRILAEYLRTPAAKDGVARRIRRAE